MDQKKIGEYIAKNRKLKNYTQEQLAQKLGVTSKTISRWENGNYMPDLSLIIPLSNALDISVNELLSGENIDNINIKDESEKNIITTINYSNQKIQKQSFNFAIFIAILGVIIDIFSLTMFPKESSFSSMGFMFGAMLFVIGFVKNIKLNKERIKEKNIKYIKIIIAIVLYILVIAISYVLDYFSVISYNVAPMYRYKSIYKSDGIEKKEYCNPTYNVFEINPNTKNQYYIVDTKKEYNIDTVPAVPFNRTKSGIDNLIKYKNKYVGDNSKDAAIINKLPLSEYGYQLKIDSENFGITIYYDIPDWYVEGIDTDSYFEKSIVYNSVSLFLLIDNLNYIKYSFNANTYIIYKSNLIANYPDYIKIYNNGNISMLDFNQLLEKNINNKDFIINIFSKTIKNVNKD